MPEFIRSGCPSFSGVHAKLSSRHGSVIVIIGRTAVHLRKRLFWRKCRLFRWQLPSQNRLQNDSWVDRTCTALTLFPGQALGGLVLETPMFIDVRINLGIVAISVATPVAFNVAIDNSEYPELSGLVLSLVDSRGQPKKGFLNLEQVYNLDMSATELAVLSACETALGKEIKGEGLLGLTQGFLYAGARRVISSLWEVNDMAAAELMGRFYKGLLKQGLEPATALRAAQLAMSNEPGRSFPYYWAGFTITGDWKSAEASFTSGSREK